MAVAKDLAKAGLPQKVMVDFSHANSSKQYQKQMEVCADVCQDIAGGSQSVFGVMVESHLVVGASGFVSKGKLAHPTYGQSITDAVSAGRYRTAAGRQSAAGSSRPVAAIAFFTAQKARVCSPFAFGGKEWSSW